MSRTASPVTPVGAYGAVRGRIEPGPGPPRGRFLLHPDVGDAAVVCSLPAERAHLVDNEWGRRVSVEGWVERSPVTGLPVSIDDVIKIEPVPDAVPGAALRAAGGIAPAPSDAPLPEEAIRNLRDER